MKHRFSLLTSQTSLGVTEDICGEHSITSDAFFKLEGEKENSLPLRFPRGLSLHILLFHSLRKIFNSPFLLNLIHVPNPSLPGWPHCPGLCSPQSFVPLTCMLLLTLRNKGFGERAEPMGPGFFTGMKRRSTDGPLQKMNLCCSRR